jgi:hypothetical protein
MSIYFIEEIQRGSDTVWTLIRESRGGRKIRLPDIYYSEEDAEVAKAERERRDQEPGQ